jgi:hypothetical protein
LEEVPAGRAHEQHVNRSSAGIVHADLSGRGSNTSEHAELTVTTTASRREGASATTVSSARSSRIVEHGMAATGNPTFAAVIPTYQRDNTVGRAIESVIRQTYPPHEVIVVDDGSTDGTQELLKSFPTVGTIVQAQAGSAAARNRGALAASSTWIAFLDSDDWWEPDHLERIANAIRTTGAAADLYFDDTLVVMHTFDDPEAPLHVGSLWEFAGFAPTADVTLLPDASECVLLPIQPIMLQSSAIRRDTYIRLGGMSERLALRHDTHLFLLLGLGRPACAVSGIGARMTDEGGDDRLTRRVPPSSGSYWDETALLYADAVRATKPGSTAHRVLTERIAVAYWRKARLALARRDPRGAIRPLIASLRTDPGFVLDRFVSRVMRSRA